MLSIILCMLCGILAGVFLRRFNLKWIDRLMLWIIYLLLLGLGIEIGSDKAIIAAIPSLGLWALSIALVAMLGSCLLARFLFAWTKRKPVIPQSRDSDTKSEKRSTNPLIGSFVILAFFIMGCLLGLFKVIDNMSLVKDLSFYTLSILIFLVGISIGHKREMLSIMKSQDWRLLLLPLFTIAGTLAATFLLSFTIPYSTKDCMAVGSGQAYYSLSSILIGRSRGIELGTIALLSNIMRELLCLLTAPFLARIFGPLAPISAGGATTADSTLPIIRRVCGPNLAVLSVYHGFVVDFSVPFIVTALCC